MNFLEGSVATFAQPGLLPVCSGHGQAIHRLCEHDQEFALHRIADQLLKAGTQQRPAADRAVRIAVPTVQPCFSARTQQSRN
ncbi:hypothetical protein [Mesorhizobium sp. M1121]|uniref:hypothetical protein n=1 Tax=Mesorhizobium sp. M1121 TaxID=2957058 RepID=UPI00333A11E6